jgi:uncharacterized cupredoxin-like copper-binding protein
MRQIMLRYDDVSACPALQRMSTVYCGCQCAKPEDGGKMIFEPSSFEFEPGETIRFNVHGELEHEFVLIRSSKTSCNNKAMMAEMDMEHDDPNSIRLDEGWGPAK